MSLTSSGVQLKKEDKKKRNFDRCILCQKVKDSKGDKKTYEYSEWENITV